MANIVKDIGEIWTRLFDHRPFLSGEIKLFLHEFEEKRDNREVDALFQILQNLTEIKYSQIDKIRLAGDSHLQPLKKDIDDCCDICNRILNKEEVYKSDTSLEKKRKLRTGEWENFIQEITKKCEKVDKAFKEKEDDLHEYYYSLERKLCASPKNISRIKNPTVHVKPSEKVLSFLHDCGLQNDDFPENFQHLLVNGEALLKSSDIDWLNNFLNTQRKDDSELLPKKELYEETEKIINNNCSNFDFTDFIREKNKKMIYLHELLKGSELVLPENEKIERNPVLAERIKRLMKEQEEREYKEMTRNVDMSKKHLVEDTIGFQLNMMNRHLIAVAQFLVSVGAGFAFGFLGIELIVGNLNFGYRLLLGIACAVVIAVAEFYFLAKHLSEEENQGAKEKEKPKQHSAVPKTKGKLHKD